MATARHSSVTLSPAETILFFTVGNEIIVAFAQIALLAEKEISVKQSCLVVFKDKKHKENS